MRAVQRFSVALLYPPRSGGVLFFRKGMLPIIFMPVTVLPLREKAFILGSKEYSVYR